METLKFKTNIKCGGCIATVTPVLNKVKGIKHWEVDINDPEKILTVDVQDLSSSDVINAVKEAGYLAEKK